MSDCALRPALDNLLADATSLAGEWRRACAAASLEATSTGTADLGVVLAVLNAARADAGESDEPVDVDWVTEALASPEARLDTVIRRLACLRDVLHRRLVATTAPDVAAEAQRHLNAAVDDLAERYAVRTTQRLEDAAFVDPLTRLLNRRALERDLVRELAQAQRHGRELSVIVSDLDGLKSINDGEGHAAGDKTLCGLAEALRGALRDGDSAYRLGGDEFVVLLPDTAVGDVPTVVERILACDPPRFSWGTASSKDHADADALLDAADRQLFERRRYDTERQGRRPSPVPGDGAEGSDPPARPSPGTEGTWRDRPVLGAVVGVLAFAAPVLASLGAALALASVLPEPRTTVDRVLWWSGLLGASAVALFVFDTLARRLLPLAALLKLSMVFPDRAPSRLSVALRSGSTRTLRDRSVQALREGDQEPAEAARTILTLAASLGAHDRGTRGHSERVRAYADLIAGELGLSAADRDRLRWAALLHDVGKLSVPPMTLNSQEPLTDEDWERVRRHPLEGARLAAPLRAWLGPWATAIEQHHERFDGTGYPHGLAGEQLSLAARIVAVADSYDAMTSVRSYSKGVTPAQARAELARRAGTHFDPLVVRAFLNVSLGRLRLVMGPLALLGALSFAPGLGGLVRRSLVTVGRTTTLGAVSLVATVGITHSVAPTVPTDQKAADERRMLVPTGQLAATTTTVAAAAELPVGPPEAGVAPGPGSDGPGEGGGPAGRTEHAAPGARVGGGDAPTPTAPGAGGGPAGANRSGGVGPAPTAASPGAPGQRGEPQEVPTTTSGTRTATTTTPPASSAPPSTAAVPTTSAPGGGGDEDCTVVTQGTCARYFFDGFFSPVHNAEVNVVTAGSSIPFKWRLTDRHGKRVTGLDTVQAAAFEGSAPGDGSSYELRFQSEVEQFVLVVKTPKSWAESERRFVLVLDDGSVHDATFRFR